MGYHQQASTNRPRVLAQQIERALCIFVVEAGRGLVSEQQTRTVHQCTSNRYALRLALAERGWTRWRQCTNPQRVK